jgi:3D-(3,5/4)-trihydroxycyclohexane-1,2-dione acylhydrolase (decyclizing)
MSQTVRLTVAQAVIRFLGAQYSERDGQRQRLVTGMFGIFGHGNVCGVGQALLQDQVAYEESVAAKGGEGVDPLAHGHVPYYLIRNEQSGVHAATGFARARNRTQVMAVTTSIGPGATNMITGAALARPPIGFRSCSFRPTNSPAGCPIPFCSNWNRRRRSTPRSRTASARSRASSTGSTRPEQLMPVAVERDARPHRPGRHRRRHHRASRRTSRPRRMTGRSPSSAERTWHVGSARCPSPRRSRGPSTIIRGRPSARWSSPAAASCMPRRPRSCASLRRPPAFPVADTHAGKGAINWDHPSARSVRVGSTGIVRGERAGSLEADVVIGIGTRYSDFTTASPHDLRRPGGCPLRQHQHPRVRRDAKHGATMLQADAREALTALTDALAGWEVDAAYRQRAIDLDAAWQREVDACYHRDHAPLPAQTEVFGALNELMAPEDVVINAAGSMPGDLQCLWRATTPSQYHVEYAFSCMGYEIPAALGVKLAVGDEHEVVAIVGDGTYQMLPMEIATLVSEGLKVIIVLLQNHGFASIGALSQSRGSQRFGTAYRMRDGGTGRLDGAEVPLDLAANAASWGADVLRCNGIAEFRANWEKARAAERTTVLYIETDLLGPNPPGTAWWDVPVAEVSTLSSTQQAYAEHVAAKAAQRPYL